MAPTPDRLERIMHTIQETLRTDHLDPQTAQKLAGRLAFLTQTVFGCVGRAAIKPIYARATETSPESPDGLPQGLRAGLMALAATLPTVKPRFIPYRPQADDLAILYADAFFTAGETRHKAGHVPTPVRADPNARAGNGWGFVLHYRGRTWYDYGAVSPAVLASLVSRRAFIYALEVVAQIIALTAFSPILPTVWSAFIDNMAGQFALMKGYGKDTAVNGILAAFWGIAARHDWQPHFERVTPAANIADAVSRADLSRAHRDGWTRVHTPADQILQILSRAATDMCYACDRAPRDLEGTAAAWFS